MSQKTTHLSQTQSQQDKTEREITSSQVTASQQGTIDGDFSPSQSSQRLTKVEKDTDVGKKCSPLSDCLPDVINRQQINHVDCIRMRNSLTEILEEVKLRRNNDIENEERIRHLVQEKYELERKLDVEKSRLTSVTEEHGKKIAEVKRQFEDKIKVLQSEVKQNQVHRDCVEKETKALKDDIRNLQINNYNLEKKLREQGRKLLSQNSSANQHLHQLSSAEEKFQSVSIYCRKLSESQDRLNRNVKEAVRLNRDLMYTNEHQKCFLEHQKGEIIQLQGQVLESKVKLDSKPLDTSRVLQEQEITSLKQHLQNEKKDHSETVQELTRISQNYKDALNKLQDSHKLIQRHLQNAEAHQRETTLLSAEVEKYKDKLHKLEIALDSLHKEHDIEKTVHSQAVDKWQQQVEEMKSRISTLSLELESEKLAKSDLEQLNTTWSEQNIKLCEELTAAKGILEVPKESVENQTDLSMLDTRDSECQIQPELSTFGNQTEQPRHYHISCQTDPLPSSDVNTQTFSPALAVSATQTREPPLMNRSVQTEKVTDDLMINSNKSLPQNENVDKEKMSYRYGKTDDLEVGIEKRREKIQEKDMSGGKRNIAGKRAKDGQTPDNELFDINMNENAKTRSNAKDEQSSNQSPNKVDYSEKSMLEDTSSSEIDSQPRNVVGIVPDGERSNESVTPSAASISDQFQESCAEVHSSVAMVSENKCSSVTVETSVMRERHGTFSLNKEFYKLFPTKKDHMIEQTKDELGEKDVNDKINKDDDNLNRKPVASSSEVKSSRSDETLNKSKSLKDLVMKDDDMTQLLSSSSAKSSRTVSRSDEKAIKNQSLTDLVIKGQDMTQVPSSSSGKSSRTISRSDEKGNKNKSLKDLVIKDGENDIDFVIDDEPDDTGKEKTSLVEKPKKLSLYESHLDGYLSKMSSGKLQSALGMKLVTPRDKQDAPRTRKFVEYLQTTEKMGVSKLKDDLESSNVKSTSPVGRGSLSLVKRRRGSVNFTDDVANKKGSHFTPVIIQNNLNLSSSEYQRPNSSAHKQHGTESTLGLPKSSNVAFDTDKVGQSLYLVDTPADKSDLSPYSRYKALLKPDTEPRTPQTTTTEKDKDSSSKKKGILKEFVIESPADRDRKSVTFSRDIVQVKQISPNLELSGDDALFSDEEDDETIELIPSQEDCSDEKRPRLA